MADTRVVCSGAMAQIVALSRDVAKLTAQLESAGVQGDAPETPNPRGKATVRSRFSVQSHRMVGSDGMRVQGASWDLLRESIAKAKPPPAPRMAAAVLQAAQAQKAAEEAAAAAGHSLVDASCMRGAGLAAVVGGLAYYLGARK